MSSQSLTRTNRADVVATDVDQQREHVTLYINGQIFGVPVLEVFDVFKPTTITPVPLAPKHIAGSLNLRGRVVTAIDLRVCLGLPPRAKDGPRMCAVVKDKNELFSFLVDGVGDVLKLSEDLYEKTPATLDANWKKFASGVYRLENKLMIVLDVPKLLYYDMKQEGVHA